ncbi:unnamed protein product [Meloidogyne enterolobii]|uniref:Uncharacterized protein n=1 Tax=Meloidogyne enterolobii TaxID=390850 RepID=A0ACB0XPW6_MELEN
MGRVEKKVGSGFQNFFRIGFQVGKKSGSQVGFRITRPIPDIYTLMSWVARCHGFRPKVFRSEENFGNPGPYFFHSVTSPSILQDNSRYNFVVPRRYFIEILNNLEKRQSADNKKPLDENCATHLIRNALGGVSGDVELQYARLEEMLMLPPGMARHYRDDITVVVIQFNEKYLLEDHEDDGGHF